MMEASVGIAATSWLAAIANGARDDAVASSEATQKEHVVDEAVAGFTQYMLMGNFLGAQWSSTHDLTVREIVDSD